MCTASMCASDWGICTVPPVLTAAFVDSYVGAVLHQLWHGLECVQRE
jgi:hypothetical protein